MVVARPEDAVDFLPAMRGTAERAARGFTPSASSRKASSTSGHISDTSAQRLPGIGNIDGADPQLVVAIEHRVQDLPEQAAIPDQAIGSGVTRPTSGEFFRSAIRRCMRSVSNSWREATNTCAAADPRSVSARTTVSMRLLIAGMRSSTRSAAPMLSRIRSRCSRIERVEAASVPHSLARVS